MQKQMFSGILAFLCAAGRAGAADGEIVYTRDIAPIFRAVCYECHGRRKQEGGLRLDREKDAMAGGKSGKAIIPGQGHKSRLVNLISLPEDDFDVMPARGDKLTPKEIEMIRTWIDQGAKWTR